MLAKHRYVRYSGNIIYQYLELHLAGLVILIEIAHYVLGTEDNPNYFMYDCQWKKLKSWKGALEFTWKLLNRTHPFKVHIYEEKWNISTSQIIIDISTSCYSFIGKSKEGTLKEYYIPLSRVDVSVFLDKLDICYLDIGDRWWKVWDQKSYKFQNISLEGYRSITSQMMQRLYDYEDLP